LKRRRIGFIWNANRVLEFESNKLKDLRQQSRVKWASFGDDNSTYFHRAIKSKATKNRIQGFNINGVWCDSPKQIKKFACKFFADRFKEDDINRPHLVVHNCKKLLEIDANSLIVPFTSEEIKMAVWQCDSEKAPGPDGFNFKFIKRYWDLIGADFMNSLQYF
jgi:hypothetical protein